MKKLIALPFILISINAYSIVDFPIDSPSYSSLRLSAFTNGLTEKVTSSGSVAIRKEAMKLQNDIQAFHFDGSITPFLEDKIVMKKPEMPGRSLEEVVDALDMMAEEVLNSISE